MVTIILIKFEIFLNFYERNVFSMTKKWIIGIVALLIIGGILLYLFFGRQDNTPNSDYTPSRTTTNITIAGNSGNTVSNNTASNSTTSNTTSDNESSTKTETKISSFSTPIVDDHENRITNIKITCSRINNTVVSSGEEFSFCEVVGQPNAADGYKEAHAFVNGKLTNAIGGGNCQVSTTIYNAAKKIDGVEITERHEHEKPVGYIEQGKDATVAYDYLDLKFENNNDFDLKLKAYIEDDKVCVDIYKIA